MIVQCNKRLLIKVFGCLAFGLLLATAITTSAVAENNGRGRGQNSQHVQRGQNKQHRGNDRDWNEHEGHAQRYWNQPYFQPEPRVVYAPPLYYPPPMYEEPGISLIFPLHIH